MASSPANGSFSNQWLSVHLFSQPPASFDDGYHQRLCTTLTLNDDDGGGRERITKKLEAKLKEAYKKEQKKSDLTSSRIVWDRSFPIPGSGMQLTNIAHVRDLSSMLTLAVENLDDANSNIFNYVSDRAVTLDGMAKLCAQAVGHSVNIVHYDPKAIGIDAKKAFPFRNMLASPHDCCSLISGEFSC